MENIFLRLLNMSINAGYLVLAVCLLRLLLKKAPKWIMGVLWALVAVRLVCPFSLESIFSLIPSAETVPHDILLSETPAISSGIPILNRTLNPIISGSLSPNAGDSANPAQIVIFAAAVIWLSGAVLMLSYALASCLRIHFKVRESVCLRENIWICDRIPAPFIFGIFRPRIYLPSSLEHSDAHHVILHEKAHLKRRDHIWKPLGFLLLTVYWFNPILWAAYVLMCRDIELACDEKVIRESGIEIKKAYSEALINCSISRKMISACPLAFGETGIKERVRSILNYKKPPRWIIIAAASACLMTAVCLMTNPSVTDIEEPLKVFLDAQITAHNASEHSDGRFVCTDCKILKVKKTGNQVSVYAWVLYEEYSCSGEPKLEAGSHIPTVITAGFENGGYILTEYWTPRDGSYYSGDIKGKFPVYLWYKAFNPQLYIDGQKAACLKSAQEYFAASDSDSSYLDSIGTVFSYVYITENDSSYFAFMPETQTSSFTFSLLSSYCASGRYEETDEYIVMKSDDGKNTYTFKKDGTNLVFAADKSSEMPKYRYSEGAEAQVSVPDGAVFEMQEPYKTYIDKITADIDGDGSDEECVLGYGPTSGLFTFEFYAYENGTLKYFNIFCSEFYHLTFTESGDKTRIQGVTQGDNPEIHLFDISIEEGNIVLAENGEQIPFWGEQGINSRYRR